MLPMASNPTADLTTSPEATASLNACLDILARVRKAQADSVSIISVLRNCVVEGVGCGPGTACSGVQPMKSPTSVETINRTLVRLRVTEVKLSALQPELWESAKTAVVQVRALLQSSSTVPAGAVRFGDINMKQHVDKFDRISKTLEQCGSLAQLQREAVQSLYAQLRKLAAQSPAGVPRCGYPPFNILDAVQTGKAIPCVEVRQTDAGEEVVRFVQQLEDLMLNKQQVFDYLEAALRDAYGHFPTSVPTLGGHCSRQYGDGLNIFPSDQFVSVSSDSADGNDAASCTQPELGSCGGTQCGSSEHSAAAGSGGGDGCFNIYSVVSTGRRDQHASNDLDSCATGESMEQRTSTDMNRNRLCSRRQEYPSGQDVDHVMENAYLRCLLEAKDRLITDLQKSIFGAVDPYIYKRSAGTITVPPPLSPPHQFGPAAPPDEILVGRSGGDSSGDVNIRACGLPHTIDGQVLRDKLEEVVEIGFNLRAGLIALREEGQRWRHIAQGFQEENELWREGGTMVRKFRGTQERRSGLSGPSIAHEGGRRVLTSRVEGKAEAGLGSLPPKCPKRSTLNGVGKNSIGDGANVVNRMPRSEIVTSTSAVSAVADGSLPASEQAGNPPSVSVTVGSKPSCVRDSGEGGGAPRSAKAMLVVDSVDVRKKMPASERGPTSGPLLTRPLKVSGNTVGTGPCHSSLSSFERTNSGRAPQFQLPSLEDTPGGSLSMGGVAGTGDAATYIEKILISAQSCLVSVGCSNGDDMSSPYSRTDSFGIPQFHCNSPQARPSTPPSETTSPAGLYCDSPLEEPLFKEPRLSEGGDGIGVKPVTTLSNGATACGVTATVDTVCNSDDNTLALSSFSPPSLLLEFPSESALPPMEDVDCSSGTEGVLPQSTVHQSMLRELRSQLLLLQSKHAGVLRQRKILRQNREQVAALLQRPDISNVKTTTDSSSLISGDMRYQVEKLLTRLDAAQESVCKREVELEKRVEAVRQYISSLRERSVSFVQELRASS
ncbi:hypothetical protein, conserved [Trypanosoma brucei gambiense DAL972]|uniref:Uncharacterized protein n=1 Tax=Trypanosoma brucei gambiense (strain MHOM/CI/86/DAL972) TaxID=679716 RepID=D0A1A0_TRYB9|nr:hypothetical protein, conserved [Trypanosoma brucei gambiense DAL972]CBH15042.1 hypothetical protein, conserved [Trypanosoma brucei gambiense DAL972]|eukprot:XP_011777308.1 hypothetical protein, conserved [Trypanosoma brucei gambiense DAL972]